MSSAIDYKQLVETSGDGIVVCDPKGHITFWNAGAERIFGFSGADAIGASLDIIVPERLRKRHWEGYEKTMETGKTRYGHDVLRVPALRKDGANISIAFTVALLHDEGGSVTGIVSIIRDETVRFKEERDLRARVAELEAGDARS